MDPSVILYIMSKEGLTLNEANTLLNKHSGLQGISGISSDMREIVTEMKGGDKRATLAFDVFSYRVKKYLGAYAAVLGGVDAVVFTGGIGENAVQVRARIVELLGFAGFALDPHVNQTHGKAQRGRITRTTSPMAAVIATNEELMIAMDTAECVNGAAQTAAA